MAAIESIISTIGSLSEKEQNELFNALRKLHEEDPFHRVKECSLCYDEKSKCDNCSTCSGCRKSLPVDYYDDGKCIKCEQEFIFCMDRGHLCSSKVLLVWNCDCEFEDAVYNGICNRCARHEPSMIKYQIDDPHYHCEAVLENPYSALITKGAT